MNKLLSKSSMNLYLQCPFKWKKCYVDKIKSKSSPAQFRGINIHRKIENFYKNKPKGDADLKNFEAFELRRVQAMMKEGKVDKKYVFPLFQELKLQSDKLGLKGILDAVYINPEDDCLICIDFKTGKYYPDKFDDYRFELAVYAELLKHSGKVNNIKYWGIYFTDQDELFFEKIDKKYVNNMYETMEKIKEGIKLEKFEPKKNKWCYFCDYKSKCPVMKR